MFVWEKLKTQVSLRGLSPFILILQISKKYKYALRLITNKTHPNIKILHTPSSWCKDVSHAQLAKNQMIGSTCYPFGEHIC